MKLSIVIPVYNEDCTVGKVINKVYNVNYPVFIKELEVIVVNDASTDETRTEIEKAKSIFPNLILVNNEINSGKGASVRKGYSIATGDALFVQDADLELSPEDIPKMLEVMVALNVEFVNGSRYMHGVLRPLSSYRRYLANKLFTFFVSVLIDVQLTDMACGYKLIHRNLLSKISLRENRFGFEAELMIKALRIKKNNIVEVPVQYVPRTASCGKKLRTIDALKILKTIIKYGIFR